MTQALMQPLVQPLMQRVIVQILGQSAVAAAFYYWLSVGVGNYWQLALNVILGLGIVVVLAILDAYGLGNWRNWRWALPAVLSLGVLAWKPLAGIAVVILWLTVLLPSAAQARWRFIVQPAYLAGGVAILALSLLPAVALVFWVPKLEGLTVEVASFALRMGMAGAILYGGWAVLLEHVRRNVEASFPQK